VVDRDGDCCNYYSSCSVCLAHILMYGRQVCDVSPYHTLAIALHLRALYMPILDQDRRIVTVSLPHWEEFQLTFVKCVMEAKSYNV